MVVPSLTALLADTARKVFSDEGPFEWAMFVNKLLDESVLFFGPRSSFLGFWNVGVQHLLPSVDALDFWLVDHFCDHFSIDLLL